MNMGRNNKSANYDLEFIKFLVNKGYGLNQVADILDVKPSNLAGYCTTNKIKFNCKSYSLTPNQIEIAAELYNSGVSIPKLTKSFAVGKEAVWYVFKQLGIKTREANSKLYKHKSFNHDAFLDMTDEKALYFYGLLLADGNLGKNKSGEYNRVSIALKEEDKYMLQNLLDYLGSDNKIRKSGGFDKRTKKEYFSNSISFNDSVITERLISYGFSPRKTLNEKVPPEFISNSRHFWRGMVDGDGCFSVNKNSIRLSLVGSFEIVNAFNSFVESNIDIITERTPKHRDTLWCVEYSGNDARKVAKLLYEDSNIYLHRKYNLAQPEFSRGDVNHRRANCNNKFGYSGIYEECGRFRVLFKSTSDNVKFNKSFNINKLGYDQALEMAISFRKELEMYK
jgi:hypothetical protein